jgi:hypothetical protein
MVSYAKGTVVGRGNDSRGGNLRYCEAKVALRGDAYYVRSLALSLLNSCGVKRRITDRTRTRFGLISLFSKNCKMTFRKYCPSAPVPSGQSPEKLDLLQG